MARLVQPRFIRSTPRMVAASAASCARVATSPNGVGSPLVASIISTRWPCEASSAMVAPRPSSASSGCAAITAIFMVFYSNSSMDFVRNECISCYGVDGGSRPSGRWSCSDGGSSATHSLRALKNSPATFGLVLSSVRRSCSKRSNTAMA